MNRFTPEGGGVHEQPATTSPESDRLTIEILAHMATGMSTTEAADACNVSLSTLRRRLDDARRAWGLQRNTELIVHAVRRGWI
jgi:DNA-binding NarL/FixJ family response regulator